MNYDLIKIILLAHLGATLYMVGLIWFVQLVHYPLFDSVGGDEFTSFERRHRARTAWVVGPPMLVEGLTAVLLLWMRPSSIPAWSVWLGLVLLAVIWLSTFVVQVPRHRRLAEGFDPAVHRRLVGTNWWRTAAWSLRGVIALGMMWAVWSMGGSPVGSSKSASLVVGDRAPEFSATTHDGRTVRLSDYLGKRALVLFFYPKDGTPICTKEACAFRDSYEQFTAIGADVVGVSSDSESSHRDFASQYRLSFPLISDQDGSLRKAFRVPSTMGLLPGRVTYVIDREGIIRQVFSAQFAADEHVRQALQALGAAD
ncbi:MAG: peroxiredoxin [Pirellulales bacterium]